jgi:hypothetical protein
MQLTVLSRLQVFIPFSNNQGRAAMLTSRRWTYVALIAVGTTAVVLADVKFRSQAAEHIVTPRAFVSQQQDTINTTPIHGSDPSSSTYGLDPTRTIDW